jgi:Domain of unknown function.
MGKSKKGAVPTTAIKSSKRSTSQMLKDMSFTVSVDPFNCRKFTTSEISRGCGVEKSKKGKGSYTRKAKHKPYG